MTPSPRGGSTCSRSPTHASTWPLGGTTGPILASLIVGPLISLFSDRWSGLLLWWKPFDPVDVTTIKDLIAAGKVKPIIDRRYPLSEVVAALRALDEGPVKGKVVITF